MKILNTNSELRFFLAEWQKIPGEVSFVPTMGNLHAGHLHLIQLAKQKTDKVIVSIFVNPLQFAKPAEYEQYPRTVQADIEKLSNMGVSALFAPQYTDLYAKPQSIFVEPSEHKDWLDDHFRPGHFVGVATVVTKLFNLVQPHYAFFGKKDYQQWRVIESLVDQLCLPVKIIGAETQREAQGLACSSRNQFLSQYARQNQAAEIYKNLQHTKQQLEAAPSITTSLINTLEQTAIENLHAKGFVVDYYKILDAQSLKPQANLNSGVVMVAACLEKVRLIDNIEFGTVD